jgi:hypothetical protein
MTNSHSSPLRFLENPIPNVTSEHEPLSTDMKKNVKLLFARGAGISVDKSRQKNLFFS